MEIKMEILPECFSEYQVIFRDSKLKKYRKQGLNYNKEQKIIVDRGFSGKPYNGIMLLGDKIDFFGGTGKEVEFSLKKKDKELYEIEFLKDNKALEIEASSYNVLYRNLVKEFFKQGIAKNYIA